MCIKPESAIVPVRCQTGMPLQVFLVQACVHLCTCVHLCSCASYCASANVCTNAVCQPQFSFILHLYNGTPVPVCQCASVPVYQCQCVLVCTNPVPAFVHSSHKSPLLLPRCTALTLPALNFALAEEISNFCFAPPSSPGYNVVIGGQTLVHTTVVCH